MHSTPSIPTTDAIPELEPGVTLLPGHGRPWTGDLSDTLATEASDRGAVSP